MPSFSCGQYQGHAANQHPVIFFFQEKWANKHGTRKKEGLLAKRNVRQM